MIKENTILRSNKTDILLIFANLLDNSIYWIEQSSPEIRIIEFRANEDKDKIIIQIADSGPGIDSSEYDLIFETGWSQKYEGTGLGLSIVKDIVESYGGKIHADRDEVLNGALFEIELPYKENQEKKK